MQGEVYIDIPSNDIIIVIHPSDYIIIYVD